MFMAILMSDIRILTPYHSTTLALKFNRSSFHIRSRSIIIPQPKELASTSSLSTWKFLVIPLEIDDLSNLKIIAQLWYIYIVPN